MELQIRSLSKYDYQEVKKIHEQYKHEFPDLPDFITNYLFSFAVCDDDGKIITVAGVRTILEVIAMTDKTVSPRQRRKALYDALEVSSFVAASKGYEEIHSFVQDEKWENQLVRAGGFKPTKGRALVREVTKDG